MRSANRLGAPVSSRRRAPGPLPSERHQVIGVLSAPDHRKVVEEFFELFKTPWEFYRQDRAYDVVLATSTRIPEVDARLLMVYGSEANNSDALNGFEIGCRRRGTPLNYRGVPLPIYGPLATFHVKHKEAVHLATSADGVAGVLIESGQGSTIRLGYDLFQEVEFLLSSGQPVEHGATPTLD